MFSKKIIMLLLSILIIEVEALLSQNHSDEKKQSFPISVAITNHSWAFPFKNILRIKPLYPGISTGSEFYYLKRPKFSLYQSVEIGGFLNSNSGSAIYINSNFSYRYKTKFRIAPEAGFGVGYFHGFHRSKIYTQTQNGNYEKVTDVGIASSSINLIIGLGFDISKSSKKDKMLFIRYQWLASTRYWSIIGIRPNSILHFGIQLKSF